jgi:hypothetical protein
MGCVQKETRETSYAFALERVIYGCSDGYPTGPEKGHA